MSLLGRSRVLSVVSMNHAVNDASVYLLSSLFPIVLLNFGLSVFQVGVLVSVGYLVSVVGQPLVGRYSEGADPKILLAIGIAIISISVFTFVISTGFDSLLASVILLRAGSSFYHPVGVSAVSRTYSGQNLDRAMGIQSAFGNFGIFLVFVAAAPIYAALGWKATFVLFGVVAALDVAITLAVLRIPRLVGQRASKNQDSPARNRHRFGTPFFFLGTTFISGACFTLVLNYTNILLQSEDHVSVFVANAAVAGWIGFAFLGAVSTGRWPRVMRRVSLLAFVFFLSAVTILFFGFVSANLLVAVPLLMINGFVLSGTYPLTYSELSDFLEDSPETKGRSFGALFSAQTIGGSIFAFVTGYLSESFGILSAYFVAGILMLVGFGMALAWSRRSIGTHAGHAQPEVAPAS